MKIFGFLSCLLFLQGTAALSSSLEPVIDLGYAAYAGNSTSPTGVSNSPVTFFGGLPYAQPPLGDLRFRAERKLDETPLNHVQVVDARSWGPPCIQQPAVVGVGSEGKTFLSRIKATRTRS